MTTKHLLALLLNGQVGCGGVVWGVCTRHVSKLFASQAVAQVLHVTEVYYIRGVYSCPGVQEPWIIDS